MKKRQNTLSLQDLSSHQQRIRSIVKKINQYSPSFHINSNYNHQQIIAKIKQQREEHEDRLFEENMNIIQKLQNIQPKIDTKRFPPVNLNLRSKRKCSSLSQRKFKQCKVRKQPNIKTEDEIFQQNIQMIEKLQIVDKKIKCWQEKSVIKSKIIREKNEKLKRNEILEKFKQISMQMKGLRANNENSRLKVHSPYISNDKIRKQSQAYSQTKANSFLTKQSPK